MSKGVDISLEGERELYVKMQKKAERCTSAARTGLRKAGLKIVNDAKENLRDNGSVARGWLRASGKAQAVEGDKDAIDVGFFNEKAKGPYAYYVEYGRRAGGFPPIDEIITWLKKKTSVKGNIKSAFESAAAFSKMKPGAYLRSLAFLIARSIAKNGTRPHPFFGPALEKNKNAISEAMAEEINIETSKNG